MSRMFAGHVGAALALGRAERRLNVGILVLAALWPDIVLWALVLLGPETVEIPQDFARTRQPHFSFPYSHGLIANLGWAAAAAGFVAVAGQRKLADRRWRAGGLVAVAMLSHWILDAVVHTRELPLAGADSLKVGAGLWQRLPLALGIECMLVVAGLAAFISGWKTPRIRRGGFILVTLAVLVLTLAGMTLAPPPPSAAALAGSSLVTLLAISGGLAWLGRSAASRSP